MPLTKFQEKLALLLAKNRSEESHLAGGAAIHSEPNSLRYSNDLDYFHDSEEIVAQAFAEDAELMQENGFDVSIEINQRGYIRAIVQKGANATKIEWAQDSAWRFMPVQKDKRLGYKLHKLDLAVNKILALAGRDEPRDFIDVMYFTSKLLSLGSLCWAAPGKDPGFTPLSILELIRRRGKYRQAEIDRLKLAKKITVTELKNKWLQELDNAEKFIASNNPQHVGCLYYSKKQKVFLSPNVSINQASSSSELSSEEWVPHYATLGGILPTIV